MMHGGNLKPNQLHVSAAVSRHHQADPNYIKAFKHITSTKVPTKTGSSSILAVSIILVYCNFFFNYRVIRFR